MALEMVHPVRTEAGLGEPKFPDSETSSAGRKRGLARSARLQLVLPESSIDRLEAIKDATEAASYAEVFRRSLQLCELLLAEQHAGSTLQIVRPDGEIYEFPVRMLFK